MAENTPPSILRERLRKTKEINDYLENELTELCEFTMHEKQQLLVEKGCSELGEKVRQLQEELGNLTVTVQGRDGLLNGVKSRIQEQRKRFSRLKNSSNDAAISPTILADEVLSAFDDLSKFIENDFADEDRSGSFSRDVEVLNITGEEVQNELTKLRQILDTSLQEGARRLSDSLMIQEKLKSRTSLFGSRAISVQTDFEVPTPAASDESNLLDLSRAINDNLEVERADNLFFVSKVEELERQLLEIGERCRVLSSANEDLENLLTFKEEEIKKLNGRLNTSCSCRRTTGLDVDYEEETLSCPIQPEIESYLVNSSVINQSILPTIPEARESSFEGSFDENNFPDLTSRGGVDPSTQGEGDGALIEKYRAEVADLQKCRTLLSDELEYCLAEIDARDEQITLLQSTLPVAQNLCAGIAASSDLFKQCNEEIESLEMLIDELEGNASNEVNAEVTGRLVNVLNAIQKGIETFGAISMYPSSDSRVESSFSNMSSATISNMSSYPQQFCSILLESSVNVNDSVLSSPNVGFKKTDEILKDARNLRHSVETIISDFTREFFNVVCKLERVEAVILAFCNMNSRNPDMKKPLKPLMSYRNVLIGDIGEKARLILDLHKSRSDKQNPSQGVSAKSSDESLVKSEGHGSEITNTNSSVYLSAVDGDEANLHFMCQSVIKTEVCSDEMLSTTSGAFDSPEEISRCVDEVTEGVTSGHEPCTDASDLIQITETTLSAFWKTVNDFNGLLDEIDTPTYERFKLPKGEPLTLNKVQSYANRVKEVFSVVLCEPSIRASSNGVNYDPDCTKLMSLDVTSLSEDACRRKPLRTSTLAPVDQNILGQVQEDKENSFHDKVTLNKAVENWEKLIHDSNKRIAELVQSKNNIEVKLSEKIADNNNLAKQLDEVQSEVKMQQEDLKEKTGLIETFTTLIANKDSELENIISKIKIVEHEASQLRVELNDTKENWSQQITDFKDQHLVLSENIDSFRAEIDNLRKEKQHLEDELKSASGTIEELKTDLVNKEQTSLDVAEELLSKEELQKNLDDVTEKLMKAEMKVSDLEKEMSSFQVVEERLAVELAEKEKLEKNLENVSEQLSVAENQVRELEMKTKTLEETRENWNRLISSSSAEIDQLKTSLKSVEFQLAKGLAEKMELEKNHQEAESKLSEREKRVSDLETELAVVNETLLEKLNSIRDLETKDKEDTQKEYLSRIAELTTALDETKSAWEEAIKSTSAEIDQLTTSRQIAEERLSKELAEKEEQLSAAERKVVTLEREIGSLNENLVNEVELRTSLQMAEDRLAQVLSEKEELVKNLREVGEHLLEAEKNEQEIGLSNDQVLSSLHIVEEQLAKELDKNEELRKNLEDVTNRLIEAENQATKLEKSVLDHVNRIHDAEMARDECLEKIMSLEQSLEDTRSSWNLLIVSSTAEIDQLKTSLKTVEVQIAKELAEKNELQNNLENAELNLSTCEKKVSDLEIENAALNDTILEKISFIRDLEARDVAQNEQLGRIVELEGVVKNLSAELDETKIAWNESVQMSSAEIDQLKASLKAVQEQLVNEVAGKEILENISEGVGSQLSVAMKTVSELERELSDASQALAEKEECSRRLEAKLVEYDECLSLNNDLSLSLHSTRKNWISLIESSKSEINRLTVLCRSLSYELSTESLKSKTLSRVLENVSKDMAFAEETISEKERHLDLLNTTIREKEDEILQLNSKYASLANNFQTLMMNCKESFRKHDQLLSRIEMELAATLLEKDNLSNLLEEALCNLEGLKQRLIEKEDLFNSVLKERDDSFKNKLVELENLEGVVSDLTMQLTVAQVSRKNLILEAKRRVDELNTSKKREEVRVMFEIVEKNEVKTKLETAMAQMEELCEGFQMNEDLIRDTKDSLLQLKYSLNDDDPLNQTKNVGDSDTRDARSELMELIHHIKGKIDKMREEGRSLPNEIIKEKATNSRLSYELPNDTPVKASQQNQSVASRCSFGTDDEYEVTNYANVHWEKSVLVSDLVPMERTMVGDHFDPLSMTINPELAHTPRKIVGEDDSSDESEFSTPVATKISSGSRLNNSNHQIRTNEKTPVDRNNISTNVTKNLAYMAAIEENGELKEKMVNYEKELLSLQVKAEESTSLHNQLTQRLVAIQNLVNDVMKVFYNRVPELPMEENIVNISKDITNLTQAIIESTGKTQSCLIDSVNMIVSDESNPPTHIRDTIAVTNTKIGAIAKDCCTLKNEMLQLSELLVSELSSTGASICSNVEEKLSCLRSQIAQKNSDIEELRDANETLQSTLIASSLEKESIRDKLNDEVARNQSLKCSFEQLEGDNSSLSAANEALIKDVTDLKLKSKELAETLDALKESNESLNSEMATVKEIAANCICSSLTAKVELLEESNSSLATANAALMKDVSDSELKNKELLDKLKVLETEMATVQETAANCRCNSLMAEVKILEENNSSLATAKEALMKDVSDSEFKNKELLDKLEVLKTEMAKAQETTANCSCNSLKAEVKLLEENNSSLATAKQALMKDVSDSEFKNKELFDELEKLKTLYGILSSDMAKSKETILELNEKVRANELQLSASENSKLLVNGECLQCKQRASELESIRRTVVSVIASTIGKPIDLSCSQNDVIEKLNYSKGVLSRANETLRSVMELLNSEEMSGIIALECLYRLVKTSDVRDVYRCKKKIAEEIHGMEPEIRVDELVQLSLLDLESKLVNTIMEKEQGLISDFQKEYENKLASKSHQLSQYESREKCLNEMIEDLTKENEKLEKALSMKSQNSRENTANTKCKEASIVSLDQSIINQEENKLLAEEMKSLNTQILTLNNSAAESTKKFKLWVSDLEKLLTNFSDSLSFEGNIPSSLQLEIKDVGFPNQLVAVLHGMYSNLSGMRKLYVSVSEKLKDAESAGEILTTRIREVEDDHAMCKESELKLEELQTELSSKDASLIKLKADHANLETKLCDLEKSLLSKDDEIVASLAAEKTRLELEVQQSHKYIDNLKSTQNGLSTKIQCLNMQLKTFSSQVASIKSDFQAYREETTADNVKTLSYFQNLGKQIFGLVEGEKKKAEAFEKESNHLRGQISSLNEENAKLVNAKRNLELSLANESAEKQQLSERLDKAGNAPVMGHDDKSCPYKEKVQEYKKELWVIRQKSDDEQKKFDVMKKNIEEDLAYKSNIIKKLEERNEANISQLNLRLATATTTYNQVCKKLEEAEERISFLRDMNSQDKKRLEKDIDNRNREITKLQSVKTFVEGLGIDCDKLEEALPEMKKKLSEFENLQTTLNDLTEKNKELDEECEFMNKQIEFLETRNAEMFKKTMETEENYESLKKELAGNRELTDKNKQLQEGIDKLKESLSQYIQALEASELKLNQTLQMLSEAELKNNQLENAYKVLETNLESRNQKILHYVSEMKNYEKMLTEKTKMNQEVRLALEEERSKYEDLALQKSSKEKDLIALQSELGECHARLKELATRLEMAADLEGSLNKVLTERDEALRSYNELKDKLPIAQQMIRSKESLVESLRLSCEKLTAENKENENILKARERELEARIQVLKTEASEKGVRIVQLESLIDSSQSSCTSAPLESYKAKISSLENEVESLKKELSRNLVLASPRHVKVDATSLSSQPDMISRVEHERVIHKLEKKALVLKRLCQQRREKMSHYENLLTQNNINVPNISTDRSH